MKLNASSRWLMLVCLFASLVFTPAVFGAETKKDAQAVLSEMRLKKWTKDLSLNADQQKKVETLFSEEGGQVAKLNQDPALTAKSRAEKTAALRSATYTKMKTLLDPAQLAVFEKMLTKAAPKKKD